MTQDSTSLQTLKNPPVIEAVIEIQLQEEQGLSIDGLAASTEEFTKRFSKKDDINFLKNHIKDDAVSSEHGISGIIYKNSNNKELTQFRLDGFSYNNLEDYPGWESFFDSAMFAWSEYIKQRPNVDILRLGLRFINLIKIPKSDDVNLFFRARLNLPSDDKVIGKVASSQYRYFSDFPESNCSSIVNFIEQPVSTGDDKKSFILDIDVVMQSNVDKESLIKCFQDMRAIKNSIFKAHLTEKLIGDYK